MNEALNSEAYTKNGDHVHLSSKNNALLGIVMAGGLSSRMGEHKATLKIYGATKPDMLERTSALLQKCLKEVWISCRKKQLNTSLPCIYDQVEGLGPVGGLHSSLNAIRENVWEGILVLSCDLPFMTEHIILELIKAREKALKANPNLLMTAFKQADACYIEALVAIYEKPALALFDMAIQRGIRRINLVVPAELQHHIVYEQKEALPFFNVNYPADLEKARRLIEP